MKRKHNFCNRQFWQSSQHVKKYFFPAGPKAKTKSSCIFSLVFLQQNIHENSDIAFIEILIYFYLTNNKGIFWVQHITTSELTRVSICTSFTAIKIDLKKLQPIQEICWNTIVSIQRKKHSNIR